MQISLLEWTRSFLNLEISSKRGGILFMKDHGSKITQHLRFDRRKNSRSSSSEERRTTNDASPFSRITSKDPPRTTVFIRSLVDKEQRSERSEGSPRRLSFPLTRRNQKRNKSKMRRQKAMNVLANPCKSHWRLDTWMILSGF